MIIDIGCGTGANIAAFANGYRCLGVDQSKEAIEWSRERFSQVDFTCGSIPFDLGRFSAEKRFFLLMDVLEHVPDDAALLADLAGMMQPGEHLLLTVPADMALWSQHDVSYGHYLRYDVERLRHAWKDLPFCNPLLSHFNARLYPIARTARALGRLRGKAWGREGTDLHLPVSPINRFLEGVLGGEIYVLMDLLEGRRQQGYRWGVSLIGLLRRKEGAI